MSDGAARIDTALPDVVVPERKARRGRKPDASGQGRARVLAAARGLFARLGFEATSIRQIANDLDVVTASLYHHFLTKEEILHEVLRAPLGRLAQDAARIASQPADAERRLVWLIVLRIEAWLDDWEAHAIAMNDAQFLRLNQDFGYVEEAKRQGYFAMEAVIRAGMGDGLFRPDLDVYHAILAIAGIINSAARSLRTDEVHTVEPPAVLSAERFTGLLIDFALRLVRTPSRIGDPIPDEGMTIGSRPIAGMGEHDRTGPRSR